MPYGIFDRNGGSFGEGESAAGRHLAKNITYDDDFKLRAITLAESYGSLSRASRELGISKSTLSRWSNNQYVSDEIVVAAKEISGEVKKR